MGLAQIDDPLVMRITFEAEMMWPDVSILRCKSWYFWERNRFIGKLPRTLKYVEDGAVDLKLFLFFLGERSCRKELATGVCFAKGNERKRSS